MNIKYDKKADTKYVRIKKGKIAYTKKEQDWLLYDCAKNGDVLGVEILDASQHVLSLSTIKGKLFFRSMTKDINKNKVSIDLSNNEEKNFQWDSYYRSSPSLKYNG